MASGDLKRDSLAAVARKGSSAIDSVQQQLAGAAMIQAATEGVTAAVSASQNQADGLGAPTALPDPQQKSTGAGAPAVAPAQIAQSTPQPATSRLSAAAGSAQEAVAKQMAAAAPTAPGTAFGPPPSANEMKGNAVSSQQAEKQRAGQQQFIGSTVQGGQSAASETRGREAAERLVASPTGANSFQAVRVSSATGPAKPASADPASAGDHAQAAMPAGGGQPTADATEVAARKPQATAQMAPTPAAGQQPVPAQNAPVDGGNSAEQGVIATADKKDPRLAETGRRVLPTEKGEIEQAGLTPKKTAEDALGSKAATAAEGKPASLQGGGEEKSGDAGKRGQPEQKEQGKVADQLANPGLGMQPQAAADPLPPEQKGVADKTLHDSILSQVKDGVVTHDGKGNGEMSIRLNPGELGELKIQVRMDDNSNLRVEVQADNKMVKDLLMSNLDSLKDALTSKNFTMAGFDVSTGGGGFNSPLPEQRGSFQQQSTFRPSRGGSYQEPEQAKVNYVTADANTLLDVRF